MVRTRSGLIVGEVVPGITVFAVVLADRAPLALAEVWTPLLPRHSLVAHLVETPLLGGFRGARVTLVRQSSPPPRNRLPYVYFLAVSPIATAKFSQAADFGKRLYSKPSGAIVLIMHRLHEDDLAGHAGEEYPELKRAVREQCEAFEANVVLIEDK